MEEPTVADMSIMDEHIVVESRTKVSYICQELSINPNHAILVKNADEILGVVTAKDIFAKMAEGINATKVKVDKIMRTNILAIHGDTPLSKGLDTMSSTNPDAIIVVDSNNDFIGYFSMQIMCLFPICMQRFTGETQNSVLLIPSVSHIFH